MMESLKEPKTVSVSAPSKLNLRLKVEGRDANNYHLLSMLNVLTTLADELTLHFTPAEGISLSVAGLSIPGEPTENLALCAAQQFFERFKVPGGVSIKLLKKIPIGSGLGGGSSDAAAVLRTCSKFLTDHLRAQVPLDVMKRELKSLALSLGADVPYLLQNSLARVTGIGEKVDCFDARFLEGIPVVIVVPSEPLPTKLVYDQYRSAHPSIAHTRDMKGEQYGEMLRVNTAARDYEPFPSRTIRTALWRQTVTQLSNDFEDVVFEMLPSLRDIAFKLRALPEALCGMTGSGSAFFVLPRTLTAFDDGGILEVTKLLEKEKVNYFVEKLIGAVPAAKSS